MIRFLVNRPIAVLISFVALLCLGGTAFLFLPTSLVPNAQISKIIVKIDGPNYSARQVEQMLSTPTMNQLSQIQKIEHIESNSYEGGCVIRLSFEAGVNSSLAFVAVNEKVDASVSQYPKEINRPSVLKMELGNIPVFQLNITPKGPHFSNERFVQASNLTRQIIKRRIEQLQEVAMVDMSGYAQPQIKLIPKQEYLNTLGINNSLLAKAFQDNKLSFGNILVRDGHYQYFLNFTSELQNTTAIEKLPINISGRIFKIGDLAEVSYESVDDEGAFFSNQERSINLAVIKQSGSKISDLNINFENLLEQFKIDYSDLNFQISQNQSNLLDYSISNLQQDLIIGGILAFLLMAIFIRKLHSSLLIGITIPASLIISQLGFYIMGISINVVSLGGLILGLGMIIDNSIVVIDNINNHLEKGLNVADACVEGTNEIIRPLITSVLTNCAVFIPLIFISGLAGAIFYDQSISITIGVIASLLVSIVLLPPLFRLTFSTKARKTPIKNKTAPLNLFAIYEYCLKFTFKYPRLIIISVILLFGLAVFTFGHLRKDRLPPITRSDMVLDIDWNENISVEHSRDRITSLLNAIEQPAEISVWIGKQQYLIGNGDELTYSQARLYFRVSNSKKLPYIQQILSGLFNNRFQNAVYKFTPSKNAFEEIFSNNLADLRLHVSSSSGNVMPDIPETKLLIDDLKKDLLRPSINPIATFDKVILKLNSQNAAMYQVSPVDIIKEIELSFKPTFVGHFQDANILIPIVLTNTSFAYIHDAISRSFVKNIDNNLLPLSLFITIEKNNDYKFITKSTEGEYYPIDIESNRPKEDLELIKKIDWKKFKKIQITYSGNYFENLKLVKEMSLILGISILLLYFILATQFESLVQPLFILVELPIALSGALISLYIANNSLNLMSMIGIIVMGGLIINDSILKIDAINQLRNKGWPLMEAIYEGGHKRLKPIVMISFTTIGSLLPTLFMNDLGSELQKPLALALIGGMFIGLFISLFFVPLLYWYVYKTPVDTISNQK